MVVHLVRRALLFDAALVHHDDAVGRFHGLFLVVGHEHAGDVHFVVQAAQPARSSLRTLASSAPKGSSSSKTLGSTARPRQRNALALAARQLMRIPVGNPVELDQLQQLGDLGANGGSDGLGRPWDAPQTKGHVFENGHVAKQCVVLEHETHIALAHGRHGWCLRH